METAQGSMEMFQGSADDLSSTIARYLENRATIDELEAKAKEARSEKERLEKALITEMQARGLDSIKTKEGVGITVVNKTNFSVPEEEKEKQVEYCLSNGLKLALSVHYQRWNSMCKEWEEAGKLPEFVKRYDYKTLSVRGR